MRVASGGAEVTRSLSLGRGGFAAAALASLVLVLVAASLCSSLLSLSERVAANAPAEESARHARFLAVQVALVTLTMLGLFFLTVSFLTRLYARPLRAIERKVRLIGSGHLGERVVPQGYLEAAQLAEAVNGMAASLAAREQQLLHSERLASLGTLVAGVAHEINNPLSYLRGNSELSLMEVEERLAAPDLAEAEREMLQTFVERFKTEMRGFDQLAHLSASLKVVSRTSTGVRQEFDLNQVLRGCLVLAHSRFKDGLDIDLDLRATQRVHGVAAELSQVFLNLFLNAADAMPIGGRLRVTSKDVGETVQVQVIDNGPGIPESIRDRLFTPFATTKSSGTGLGLHLAKRIVHEHGGEVGFETGAGGTTFLISLPGSRSTALGTPEPQPAP